MKYAPAAAAIGHALSIVLFLSSGLHSVAVVLAGHVVGQCGSPLRHPQVTGQKYDSGLMGQKLPASTHLRGAGG